MVLFLQRILRFYHERARRFRVGLLAAILLITGGPACVDPAFCRFTDVGCEPLAWLGYLVAASNSPAPCQGGLNSGSPFFGFYGGNGNDRIESVCATTDGGYVTVGRAGMDIATLGGRTPILPYVGNDEPLIIKLDAVGAVEWYSFAGAFTNDEFRAVIQATDGGYVAVGLAGGNIATLNGRIPLIPFQSAQDWLVVRFSATGQVEWYTFLGDTGGSVESAQGIVNASDGGYIVTGSANDMDGMPVASLNAYAGSNFDMTAVKLSSAGAVEWWRFFGSGVNEQALDLVPTADGGFVTAGLTLGAFTNVGGATPLLPFNGPQDTPVVKFDSAGTLLWHSFLGAAGGNQTATAVTETSDGGIAVIMDATGAVPTLGGIAPTVAFNANDIYVAKLDTNGGVLWHTFLATASIEAAGSIAPTTDGGVFVAGRAGADIPTLGGQTPLSPYSTNDDILIVRLSATGSVVWYTFVGGINNDTPLTIQATGDGGFVLGAESSSNLATIGSLNPVNPFVNANEFLILRGDATGNF